MTPRPDTDPRFLGVADVAARLSVSERTIRRHIAAGIIPHTYLGRRVLVPSEALDRLRADALGVEVADARRG